jgi:hypothetical protein
LILSATPASAAEFHAAGEFVIRRKHDRKQRVRSMKNQATAAMIATMTTGNGATPHNSWRPIAWNTGSKAP